MRLILEKIKWIDRVKHDLKQLEHVKNLYKEERIFDPAGHFLRETDSSFCSERTCKSDCAFGYFKILGFRVCDGENTDKEPTWSSIFEDNNDVGGIEMYTMVTRLLMRAIENATDEEARSWKPTLKC